MKSNMNKILSLITITILSILSFIKCSSSVPQKEIGKVETELVYQNEILLNVKKVYSWINAMPGQKPRFQITGELEILDDSNYNLERLKIVRITILQDKKMIFIFKPNVKEEMLKNKKSVIFSTVRGLLLNAALNEKKPIDIVIEFNDGSTEFKYTISNITIEKAV
ncbi:hypothetical protein MNBD_IGNAVI01-954 [hydrothermal vent metagenome]|uniref:Uncharacterized protein n=1 Tax=hydrothermal vent metagenome TaxID=652676 RepID=A0A3B1CUF2_9ZZZZ